mmetsp:Transcript_71971/g.191349  ORF Transcript_71971/g.191349 Transcript_71971/m.191349 type:complete len:209 (+) Transcript_71971:857-1483(+)
MSHPRSCSSSSHTDAIPVTKPRPVSSTTDPSFRPSCWRRRMLLIASASRSRWWAERRACPNSAIALCEQPCSMSHANAYASRGVVAGKESAPVSARMPSAKSVASVSLSSSRAGDSSSAGLLLSSASARRRSTRTVVAEPTGSRMYSSGSMSPLTPTWWSTTTMWSAACSHGAAGPIRSTACVSTTPTAWMSSALRVLKPRRGRRCLW